MKTIEQIADVAAQKRGYRSIDMLLVSHKPYDAWQVIKEVSDEHAKQCCDEQIKACAENAKEKVIPGGTYKGPFKMIDKDSILSTPNVAEKP